MRVTKVKVPDHSYPIYLGKRILAKLPQAIEEAKFSGRAAIVCDNNVARLHLTKLIAVLKRHGVESIVIRIPHGERQKSMGNALELYGQLARKGFRRNDFIIGFGGGVVGDLAGFVAATFRRGISYVQVPTTLLGQIESSIGGKTGVNLPSLKNAVGAFHQPGLVFSDVEVLSTLPRREIISGLGEAVKYAFFDEGVYRFLDKHLEDILSVDLDACGELVYLCNAIKAKLVAKDERETNPNGGRAILNLGHTVGQALEVISEYRLRHGEAVLIGLTVELLIAEKSGLLDHGRFLKLRALLSSIPYRPGLKRFRANDLLKKLYGNKNIPRFALPTTGGSVSMTSSPARSLVSDIIRRFFRR